MILLHHRSDHTSIIERKDLLIHIAMSKEHYVEKVKGLFKKSERPSPEADAGKCWESFSDLAASECIN